MRKKVHTTWEGKIRTVDKCSYRDYCSDEYGNKLWCVYCRGYSFLNDRNGLYVGCDLPNSVRFILEEE